MPAPFPAPKTPPSNAPAPAPITVCSIVSRPRPPDSMAPSTLHNFGVNRRPTPVWHHQPAEPEHHASTALDFAGYVNLRNVSVHSGVLIVALVNTVALNGSPTSESVLV